MKRRFIYSAETDFGPLRFRVGYNVSNETIEEVYAIECMSLFCDEAHKACELFDQKLETDREFNAFVFQAVAFDYRKNVPSSAAEAMNTDTRI